MSLQLKDVCIDRGGRRIVTDISLTVEKGEVLAIAGPNGSGKSTLLGAISGEIECASGHVLIENRRLCDWDLSALAKQRAVLLQESPLSFPFTVIDVVLMGRSAHHKGIETDRDIEIARSAIEQVGLNGFEGRRYTQLSGGEKQRVHLARVLSQVWHEDAKPDVHRSLPKYLILDEPTSSQDMAAQHLVLRSAKRFAQMGTGVICVLHDLNQAAQYADRILILAEGKMECLGTPDQTLTPPILERVYGLPVRVLSHTDYPYPIVLSNPADLSSTA